MKTKKILHLSRFLVRFKTLFVILTALGIISMSAIVSAETIDGIEYALDTSDNTASAIGYTGTNAALVIPASIVVEDVTYSVTQIGDNAFQNNTTITSVQLPNALVSIGLRAFQSSGITTGITIPASVVTIDDFAFADLGAIAITFETQSQLEFIGVKAFRGTTITLPTVRDGYTVTWKVGETTITDYTVTGNNTSEYTAQWISDSAVTSAITFNANGGVGTMDVVSSTVGATVTLPVNIFTRDGYYFKGWATTADGEVLYVDEASFTCEAEMEELFAVWGLLGKLILDNGEGVQDTLEIGVNRTLTLPATSFTKAGHYLYGWATTAEDDAYYSFGAFYTPLSTSQTLYAIWEPIPEGYTFEGMEMLKISEFTPVVVDQTLSITSYTGKGQDSTYLYIPPKYVIEGIDYTVTELGDKAFMSCGITNIILPSTLESLGVRSLHNNNLDSIIIPANVTKLSNFALAYNYALKKVIFEEGSQLETIGENAFLGHAVLDSITIPASVKSIGTNAFDATTLDGLLPNRLQKVSFEAGSQLDSIASGAFDYCTALNSITLPSTRPGYTVEWKKDGVVLNDYLILNADLASVFTAVWIPDTPVALDKISAINEQLVISPNPADDYFTLNVKPVLTEIYTLSGQCEKQYPMGMSTFDVSSLKSGIYIVKVHGTNDTLFIQQLIKK